MLQQEGNMQWSEHYQRYARYNRWITRNLLDASETLPQATITQPCGLFFGSLSGSWNHLLVTDLIWLRRLSGIFPILDELRHLPQPQSLDQIVYPTLAALRPVREQIDDLLIRWCDLLRADDANDVIEYTNSRGEEVSKPLSLILQHLFNHQTHHRGQITAELSRHNVDYGITDLLYTPFD